ncbi:glycoside hydrolase family 32 protein [Bacillus sp. N1-1]|jgi:fructan beta-fructosidase|uniref:glycoside hydrolase family 32 protein n=1 Tax=Bacillus sp. N1-1 TaxID=2682541 RepID=UPI001316B104|nr:glycoside hydrolase family 32 protein [Bacillus sp. N1-1]QHA90840.1 glycoside hydrolase family 32 protein [Bacillus sp. N1-1]
MRKWLLAVGVIVVIGILIFFAPFNDKNESPEQEEKEPEIPKEYNQSLRPQFHYTPKQNWMNDPNGMVYFEGKYHLFYQHNPTGNEFGNMGWGHAVSEDLYHWEEKPMALEADDQGMIFSGGAVYDKTNTSGLFAEGKAGLVAFYTIAGDEQTQGLAYSEDGGETWKKYRGNPILPNPGVKDFRDPKVVWHEESEKWIMLLAAGNKVIFYGSDNLIDWEKLSEFGVDQGAQGGVWETPELFQLPVDGDSSNEKWVLQVDMNPGSIAGGSGGQYFIGDFDGKAFTREGAKEDINWVDYGTDFYAAQAFSNHEGNPIWLAWMSNWMYASDLPTDPWKGAMSLPREVSLKEVNGETRLIQEPAGEIESNRSKKLVDLSDKEVEGRMPLDFKADTYEVVAEFDLDTSGEFGFRVRKGDEEETIVGYDSKNNLAFVDRQNSGDTSFHEQFPGVYRAPLEPTEDGKVKLHLFVDRSSVELFANDGKRVMTNRIFPSEDSDDFEIYAMNGKVTLESLEVYELDSSWKTGEKE